MDTSVSVKLAFHWSSYSAILSGQLGELLIQTQNITSFICGFIDFTWTSAMADREDNVYQAKLAEQAERYDGKFTLCLLGPLATLFMLLL